MVMDKYDLELMLLRDFYNAWKKSMMIPVKDEDGLRPRHLVQHDKELARQEMAKTSDSLELHYAERKKFDATSFSEYKNLQDFRKGLIV